MQKTRKEVKFRKARTRRNKYETQKNRQGQILSIHGKIVICKRRNGREGLSDRIRRGYNQKKKVKFEGVSVHTALAHLSQAIKGESK